jgi:hypothetical protein
MSTGVLFVPLVFNKPNTKEVLISNLATGTVAGADRVDQIRSLIRDFHEQKLEFIERSIENLAILLCLIAGPIIGLNSQNSTIQTGGFSLGVGALGAVIQRRASIDAAKVAGKTAAEETLKSMQDKNLPPPSTT